MTLIKCPECDNEISDKAKKCPHCGCSNKGKKEEKMNRIVCPECGEEYEVYTSYCSKCGYDFTQKNSSRKSSKVFYWLIIIVLSAAAMCFAMAIANSNYEESQSNTRDTSVLQVKVITEYINIRKSKSVDSEAIGKVYEGEIYTVLSEDESSSYKWIEIRTSNNIHGYISGNTDYVLKLKPSSTSGGGTTTTDEEETTTLSVTKDETKEIVGTYGSKEIKAEITVRGVYWTTSLLPPTPRQSYYSYFPEKSGEVYHVIEMDVKNTGTDSISDYVFEGFLSDCTPTFVFTGGYKYTGITIREREVDSRGKYDLGYFYSIDPLATKRLYLFTSTPEATKDLGLTVNVCFGDDKLEIYW